MLYRSIPRCPEIKVSEIAPGCKGFIDKSPEDFPAMWERALAHYASERLQCGVFRQLIQTDFVPFEKIGNRVRRFPAL